MDEYSLINVRRCAEKMAEEWFIDHYEVSAKPSDIYDTELVEGHGMYTIQSIKPHLSTIFWGKVSEIEEFILTFEKK